MALDDLAPYMASPTAPTDGYHQGVVEAWDSIAGTNRVSIAGQAIDNLPVVTTSDSIMLAPGDVVIVLKFQFSFFILGRVAVPGAGAALQIRAETDPATGYTASTTWGGLSIGTGPTLSDVYIGSSRRCMVIVSVGAGAEVNSEASAHFSVTGASTIPPPTAPGYIAQGASLGSDTGGFADATRVGGTATRVFLLTAADGLNRGLHTFTVVYASLTGDDAFFSDRTIVVFPY
jgi:hypothetical protein